MPSNATTGNAELDLSPMVARACIAAVVGFIVKLLTMWQTAIDRNAHVDIGRWHVLPFLRVKMSRSGFTAVTSSSTVALGFAVLFVVLFAVLRNGDVVRTAGWLFSIVGLATTLAVDAMLQHLRGGYTDGQRLRWASGSLTLCLILVVLWVVFERPHHTFVRAHSDSDRVKIARFSTARIAELAAVVVVALSIVGLGSSAVFDRPNLLASTSSMANTSAVTTV